MNYRTIPNTGIKVSTVALGCWQFAGGAMWGDQEEKDNIQTAHAALDLGINLFDTAEGYGAGKSEEVLGKALKGKRENAVIATKSSGPTYSPDELIQACENSLKRLRTDYVDIYQLHWPRPDMADGDTIFEGVSKLIESGKILHFSVCNFGVEDMKKILLSGNICTNQLNYSLLWRGIEFDLVPKCTENEIGIFTYSSLVHGLLSGKYSSLEEFPKSRARSLHFSSDREEVRHNEPGQEELTAKVLSQIRSLCSEAGINMVDAAFGWVIHQPQITSVLAGAGKPEQVTQNAAIGDMVFPDGFLYSLSEATQPLKDAFGNQVDMWETPGRIK
ncbi:MAG: aldo/keto reductase [Spirochaetales bacterium]|jgi:myo-inositol catabolism protein IolS|nr:aldo/keto reductase [Spirochaetales bacterium]